LLVAVTTLAALTAAACDSADADIGVGSAGRGDVVELVDAPATVTAKAAATLSAPADGTLVSLAVKPGDTVTAGQVLAVIDSPSAQARLDDATAALRALRSSGGGRSTDLSGTQRKTDEAANKAFAAARDAASRIADPTIRGALLAQIEAAERAYLEAAASARALVTSVQRGLASVNQAMSALTAAQRAQAQAAYDLAKSTVDALTLRAPVAGVVQLGGLSSGGGGPSLNDLLSAAGGAGAAAAAPAAPAAPTQAGPGVDPAVPLGGKVGAGTAVLTVVDVSELGLLAEVDETDVLLVQPGVPASVELDAAPGARYEATVSSIDIMPSTSVRGGVSYRARLKLGAGKYGDGRVAPTPRPGMNAVAHLEVRSIRDTVTVPAAAVFNAGGKDAVWLVRNGKAVQAPVTVGVAGQDRVQVLSGISDGDKLVVRGADKVRAGMELP